jgi:3-oxoacyl-[acyl-carrier protein] reductase
MDNDVPNDSLPLSGSVALVTGSSRRIGKAIAMALAEAGADVVIHARSNRDEAEKTAQDIRRCGVRSHVVLGDVGDPDAAGAIIADAVAGLGRLDILVNNASSRGKSTLDTTSFEQWRRVLAITLDGAFLLCQAALPHLRASDAGRIINIGGASGHMGSSNHLHVIAAKSGLQGLTKAMAHDLGPDGITANMVSPGLIEDPGDDPEKAAFRRTIYQVDRLPLRRPGAPAEIGAAVAMLAAPASGYITGQTIHVNGGVLMP